VGHAVGRIDDLGNGVFRKVRQALDVRAFGANAMVLEPRTGWFNHFHERQDELYFVHRGRAGFDVDGDRFEVDAGGSSTSTRPHRGGSGTSATKTSCS
jgi:mannose-6-phosphate isomerase-like protein (cupin superfamily)